MNCSQCSNPLTANAKFCKNCGAKQAIPAAAPATRTEPPLIEPMDLPAASPVAVAAPIFLPPRHDRTPAFPQEPASNSKAWIKWAALALVVAAIAGGVLMANNMKGLSGSSSTPAASQAGKDAVSPEDKAKADALVGPQGGNAAAPAATVNDPSSVTIVNPPPRPDIPPPPTVSPAPAAPVISTGPELAPPPAAGRPVTPAPVKAPPARKSGGPSLNDLLD